MKKTISYILITLVLTGTFFLFSNTASAQVVDAAPNLTCSLLTLDLESCFALTGYYLFYLPTAWVLIIAGALFDTLLAFSLNSVNLDQAFVQNAWEIVRDISNLFFIFILLYIAISTILQTAGDQLKKMLLNVIIVGLVINFSFFFTRLVIDASNIFAIEFYNKIGTVSNSAHTSSLMPVVERSVSAGFISAFNPQKIMSSDTFKKWQKDEGFSKSVFFVLFLVGAVINIFAAYVFFLSGFLLVARVLSFMFLIIASPVAFMAYIVPGKSGYASKWWGQLVDQALMAPILLFFFYVITTMIAGTGPGTGFTNNVFSSNGTILDILISMALQATIVIMALLMALEVAKKLSGKAGDMMGKYVSNPALKYTKAGASFAAVQTIGRAASSGANSDKMKGFSRRNPFMGSLATGALDKIGGKKYDKWQGEQTKKTTAAGDRATKFTDEEEERAKKIEATMKARLDTKEQAVKSSEQALKDAVLPESKKSLEEVLNRAKESRDVTKSQYESRTQKAILQKRREQYAGNLGTGAVSKILGTDKINRDAAKKIRKGEDGKGSTTEKLVEELKKEAVKEAKEKEAKAPPEEPKTKPGE